MVTLSITKTYATNAILTEAMLDNIKNDVESWANGNIDSTNINFGGSIAFRTSGNDSLDFNDSTDTMSFKVDGTTILDFIEATASITLTAKVQDADMVFTVNDGGVDTTAITVTGSTANVTVAKALTVTGAVTMSSTAAITGALTVTGESTLKDDVECLGAFNYKASAAGTDTYAITYDTAPAAYEVGQVFLFKTDVANTAAATLNVNALGAKNIQKSDGSALADLATGDIIASQMVLVGYDGTQFQLLGGAGKQYAHKVDVITATGTWTRPSNVTNVVIEAWGAGGGSGGGSSAGGGGGGGGGSYAMDSLAVSGDVSVTIGAAGTAGTSNGTGGTGGTTTFSTVSCVGGTGGASGDGGGTGGAGGTASGG